MPRRNLSPSRVAYNVVAYLFFALFTLLCVFPFYYMFINSISSNEFASRGQVLFYPRGVHFDNYLEILKIRDIGDAALVSVARTVIGTVTNVFFTSFVAYILSKKILWHRKFWYRFFIVTMYFNVGLLPWFINMQFLGLTNNFLAYVIAVINPYNLVLVKTYIEGIPASLEESAEIDGAGPVRIFLKIVFPLSKPIIATTAVFTAVMQWNQVMDTIILMPTTSQWNTLQFLLWRYLNETNAVMMRLQGSGAASMIDPSRLMTPTSLKMTIAMVVVLPILFVYPFFQRFFVKGIMLGSVKG